MTTYDEVRGRLKTGDIILTGGTSLFSKAIKFLTKSEWSHVGMVVRTDEWNFVLMWESTTPSGVEDVRTGEVTRGVQLVPLSERVRTYKGSFAVRQISRALTVDEVEKLKAFRAKVRGRNYDMDALELLGSAIDVPFLPQNTEDIASLFCCELIAETYQELGLLDEVKPSNEYVPHDFSERAGLQLQGDINLGPETNITWS